jgi:RimJ/RimL family protein N-acetyltransferase
VAQAIQADGRVPVWSCGAPNLASMAIARRLGFEEVSRRTYLIPEWDDE